MAPSFSLDLSQKSKAAFYNSSSHLLQQQEQHPLLSKGHICTVISMLPPASIERRYAWTKKRNECLVRAAESGIALLSLRSGGHRTGHACLSNVLAPHLAGPLRWAHGSPLRQAKRSVSVCASTASYQTGVSYPILRTLAHMAVSRSHRFEKIKKQRKPR